MKTDFELTSTAIGSVVSLDRVMDSSISPLYLNCPKVYGPAFTVEVEANDNLTFHQAIYEAPPGAVIVAVTGGSRSAVAGGNVCAVAQSRGIAGFVIDGFIRDVGEIELLEFPVFARGACPVPGTKERLGRIGEPVDCGGVLVMNGDFVVADRDGIVVLRSEEIDGVLDGARQRALSDNDMTLELWQTQHKKKTVAKIQSLRMSTDKGR